MIDRVVVEADGGSRGNPGPAGFGAVVLDPASGEVLAQRMESIGRDTNNVAEYRGLIAGLQAARDLGASSVHVRMDSKLVVEQMSGRWQVKNEALRLLVEQAADLTTRFADVSFEWIPRARNGRADRLANEAMDAAAGRPSRQSGGVDAGPAGHIPMWTASGAATATRLVLLRHGSTRHSPERRFSGHNELPLTEEGERQARVLASRAAGFELVDAVLSSPLRRARQTADIVAEVLDRPVQTADAFVEADFGAWEGLTLAEAQRTWPAEVTSWLASPSAAPPGGESLHQVERRVRRARDSVIATHPGGTVVIVSHLTPIKALLRLGLDAPPSAMYRLHLDTGSMSVVDYLPSGQCSVRLVNDTGRLPDR